MTDSKFNNSVLLFAEVIVPDFQHKPKLKELFLKNFNQLINQLEYQGTSKIKLLVSVIEILSFVYNFKAFHKLTYQKRTQFVAKLFLFPVGKIVAGLTGLRSLVLISYYGLEDVVSKINTNPDK